MKQEYLWYYKLRVIVDDNVIAQTHFDRFADLVIHSFQHIFPGNIIALDHALNTDMPWC